MSQEKTRRKIILSTLGVPRTNEGKYEEVTYNYGELQETTPFFVKGLAKAKQVERVYVLTTPKAEKTFDALQTAFQSDGTMATIQLTAVDIPNGENQAELEQIFETIAALEDLANTDLILDITHAFRSLPMLMLSAVYYLQDIKDIHILDIYYGAFEAKNQATQVVPVFSLKFFDTLVEWSQAFNIFNQTGAGHFIGRLLQGQQQAVHTDPILKASFGRDELPTKLQNIHSILERLAWALDLVQPDSVMALCAELVDLMNEDKTKQDVEKWSSTFKTLFEAIKDSFADLALDKPRQDPDAFIAKSERLLAWYIEHERYTAAFLLLREQLVSLFMQRQARHSDQALQGLFDDEKRTQAEGILNSLREALKNKWLAGQDFGENSGLEGLLSLWNDLGQQRNIIAHTAMQAYHDEKSLKRRPKDLRDKIIDYHKRLKELQKPHA
jgi:CRISPR-associated DxTHG motif protein